MLKIRNLKNILYAILFISLILRVIPVFILHYPVEADASEYDNLGWNLVDKFKYSADGVDLSIARVPGYPIFLAAVYFVFGHNIQAVLFFQALLGMASVWLIYLIARLIFKRDAPALICAGLAAIYPMFIYYSLFIYSEIWAVFLMLLFAYLFFNKFYLTSGLAFAILVLTKPLFFFFLIVIFGFIFFNEINAKISGLKIILRRTAFLSFLFVLPLIVLGGAWGARNYHVFGEPAFLGIGGGRTLLHGNYPFGKEYPDLGEVFKLFPSNGMNEIEHDRFLGEKAVEWIKANPIAFVKIFFIKVMRYLGVVKDLGKAVIYKKSGEGFANEIIFPLVFLFYKFFKIIISAGFILGSFFVAYFSVKIKFYHLSHLLLEKEGGKGRFFSLLFLGLISWYSLIMHAIVFVDERYHLITFPFHLIIAVFVFDYIFKKYRVANELHNVYVNNKK